MLSKVTVEIKANYDLNYNKGLGLLGFNLSILGGNESGSEYIPILKNSTHNVNDFKIVFQNMCKMSR